MDRIKIAQNFVLHLGTEPGDASIVRATIGLARELGMEVIAEGVENPRPTRPAHCLGMPGGARVLFLSTSYRL